MDTTIGSFSICNEGLFNDFATNDHGDLIDLVSQSRHVDKAEAARIIVQVAGGTIPDYLPRRLRNTSGAIQKKPAIQTIPEEKIAGFMPPNAMAIWHYRDLNGNPWCATVRFDDKKGKRFIPYYFDGQDWKSGNPIEENRPLFNADKLAGNDLPVLIVEGEKCASIPVEGFISITWIGGCNAVTKTDFSPLRDRVVITWPDADEPGIKAALKIKELLPHAEILQIDQRPKGWDIADAAEEGIDLVHFIYECPRMVINPTSVVEEDEEEGKKRGRPRKSKRAMELLQRFRLCRHNDKRYMIRDNQAIQIGTRTYKDFVASEYFRATGEPLTSVQIDEVVSIHRAHAGESEEQAVYIRTACPSSQTAYIDLNDGDNTIIEVNAHGCRKSINPPVLFFRPNNMGALPIPDHGGSAELLRKVINLQKDEDFPVLIATLCYILRGRPINKGSYPIIIATGIEGSAKTTFMKIIKKLIDPGIPETRTPSNEIKDLFIAASNGLILSLDNISHINREMSDALCSLVTSGGYARKKNYSDDEEQIFDICRPVLLNGITFDRAPDLISRSLVFELRPITQEERKTESELWTLIEQNHASILGGLLTMISNAIREEEKMKDERFNLPRLADFGRFAIALERGNGWEEGRINSSLMASYEAALGDKAEGNPVIPIIISIIEKTGYWCGSATKLLAEVNEKGGDIDKRLSVWPKTAEKLGKHLKRNHNVYATKGITINQIRDKHGRVWELSKKTNTDPTNDRTANFDDLPILDTL